MRCARAIPCRPLRHRDIGRIAEHKGDHWQLTRQSLRAAVTAGMDVPAVIALPEQMMARRRRLNGRSSSKPSSHYGDAQVASVILLRLVRRRSCELRRLTVV